MERSQGTYGQTRRLQEGAVLRAVHAGWQEPLAQIDRYGRTTVPSARTIATHPRLRKAGDRHTVRDHQPPAAQAWLEHDPQWCLARAREIGPSCHALVLAMFNDTVLVNLRGAQGIVRM